MSRHLARATAVAASRQWVDRRWGHISGWFVRLWAAMDRPVEGRAVPGSLTVGAVTLVIAGVAGYFADRNQSNLWYADALSHITIARRIFDNKAPGFQQLGTFWLPMPHLLLMPFVAELKLWATGIGATVLGSMCAAASAIATYRIAARLGMRRGARLVAVLSLWTCVGLVYIDTTPLTEPVLYAGLMCSAAGLVHWATSKRPMSGGELSVYAGIPAMIATLSRFEGWAFDVAIVPFIVIVEWRRSHGVVKDIGRHIVLRRVVPALAPSFLGIVWWLGYNYAEYHNALQFMTGQGSASASTAVDAALGSVLTKGSLAISIVVYQGSVWEDLGGFLVIAGALGFAIELVRDGLSTRTLTIALMASTYVFMIASLYVGQAEMANEHSIPAGLHNLRYALSPIFFFALGLGSLVDRVIQLARRWGRISWIAPSVAALALAGQGAWAMADVPARVPVVAEASGQWTGELDAIAAAHYLKQNYHGGGILTDESVNTMLPLVGLPLKDYWDAATGKLFQEAMKVPTTHARWIFVNTDLNLSIPDQVYEWMRSHPQDYAGYVEVFQSGFSAVFRLARQQVAS